MRQRQLDSRTMAEAAAIGGAHYVTYPAAHWHRAGTSRGARKHGTAVGSCVDEELTCVSYYQTDVLQWRNCAVAVTGGNLAARCDSIISQLSLAVKSKRYIGASDVTTG